MASQQTPNYNLNQWIKTDRIMMEDFNADNAKIDAALLKRNCRFYTATYQGDGRDSRTHTFPAKPVFIFIYSSINFFFMMRNAELGINYHAGRVGTYDTTWTGNSVTLSHPGSDDEPANNEHYTYNLFAILDADAE